MGNFPFKGKINLKLTEASMRDFEIEKEMYYKTVELIEKRCPVDELEHWKE